MGYKQETHVCTIAEAVSSAISDLQSLGEECREIVDNASEGLAQTQRIQTFEETADTLENYTNDIEAPSAPKNHEDVGAMSVTYFESINVDKRRGPSRARRHSDAISRLQIAVDAINTWLDDNETGDYVDEISAYRDEVQDMIDNCEGVEFPGMYG